MGHGHPHSGHQAPHHGRHLADVLHPVVHEKHLALAGQLALDGLGHGLGAKGSHVGLDGPAVGGGIDDAQIPEARQAHLQGAGNGGGGEGEHVHQAAHLFEALLVLDPEALFLVHHHEAQILELHVLLQDAVGADHDVHRARLEPGQDLPLLGRGLETAQGGHLQGLIHQALHEGLVVLLGQHRSGHQKCHLASLHGHQVGGAQGHLGLAEAHVAAHQAVHGLGGRKIGQDVLDGPGLVRGLLPGKPASNSRKALSGGVKDLPLATERAA